MSKKLSTVILAAGKGKRMKNPDKSKVMFELDGKPMIEYVIQLALNIGSENIILIVGHQKQTVIEFIRDRFKDNVDKIKFASQDQQLGTGHAVMQTEEFLKGQDGDVLILSGDVPLLKTDTVRDFIDFHNSNNYEASLISAKMDNPVGYGRILRDENEIFHDIREEKDCNDEEKACNEINSGIYIIGNEILFDALKNLKTDNVQGEYYLTDVFKEYSTAGKNIGALPVDDILEITGINTVEQLEELENIYRSSNKYK